MATDLMKENTREDLAKELADTDIYEWAEQGYQYAKDYVYPNVSDNEKITEDGDYTKGARPIVH